MARTKQTARKCTGGKLPHKHLASKHYGKQLKSPQTKAKKVAKRGSVALRWDMSTHLSSESSVTLAACVLSTEGENLCFRPSEASINVS